VGILTALLTLPYAPVRGLTSVVRVIAQEAEARRHSPAAVRRELEELDEAAAAGQISPRERDEAQQQVLERVTSPAAPADDTEGRKRTTGGRGAPRRGR
jgi:hypothetical protein